MASNCFGEIFRWTTWGESHGKAIGVVIDGCPAQIPLTEEIIQRDLDRRAPGTSPKVSPRREPDRAEILSGVFEGKTTGAPISILIANCDANSRSYDPVRHLVRPGHANATYLAKYGVFDHRGGGRASARETACRVAAGAVAKTLLGDVDISARVITSTDVDEGDSIGGIVEAVATGVPSGLGDPIYQKLEAQLAYAMLSIPASRGFEIGSGFSSATMCGSEHNRLKEGVLGGISTGQPISIRVAFKPTSSINKVQTTTDFLGNPASFQLPKNSRHDPCVAIRAVPVVEAMFACVLADRLLQNQNSSINLPHVEPI